MSLQWTMVNEETEYCSARLNSNRSNTFEMFQFQNARPHYIVLVKKASDECEKKRERRNISFSLLRKFYSPEETSRITRFVSASRMLLLTRLYVMTYNSLNFDYFHLEKMVNILRSLINICVK